MKGIKCENCGALYVPPLFSCTSCGGTEFEEVEFEGKGKIDNYTVIHVPPTEFSDDAPYTVAIVELEEGAKATGRIKGDASEIELEKPVEYLSEDKYRIFELSE